MDFKIKNCPACGSRRITSYDGKTKCKKCGYTHINKGKLCVKIGGSTYE